jgi:hypothetical protein
MSGRDRFNGGKYLPAPPPNTARGDALDRPIGKIDGRSARATGRR